MQILDTLGKSICKKRVDVIGKVSIDRSGKRGHETIEHFEIPEIELNEYAGIVKVVLKCSDEFPHILSGFGKQDPFVLNIELFL